MEEKWKADNEKLTLELRIIEDEFTAEKLLYKQHVMDLQQTIILNHIHKPNGKELLFIDLMAHKNKETLKQQCNHWKSYRSELENQKMEVQNEKQHIDTNYKHKIEELQQNIDDYLMVIAELNHQNAAYTHTLHENNDSLTELNNELKLKHLEIVHLTEQNTIFKQNVQEMEQSNDCIKSTLHEKQSEYQELLLKYNQLQSDLNEQKRIYQYLQESTQSKLKQYEIDLKDVTFTKNELQNNVDSNHKSIKELQMEIENEVTSHKEIMYEYKEKMNALTLSNTNKNNELIQMKEHTKTQIQSWNETKQLMIHQQHDISKALQIKNQALHELQQKYNALMETHDTNAKLSQSEMNMIHEAQHKLTNEYKSKCSAFDELLEIYTKEKNEYQEQIQNMKEELDNLINVEIYGLNHNIMQYQDDIKCKMEEIHTKITENEGLMQTIANIKGENDELNETLATLRSEGVVHNDTMERLNDDMKQKERFIQSQSIDFKNVRDDLNGKNEELKCLRSEHERYVYKNTKLEAMLNEIRNLHKTTKQELKMEYDALRIKYDDKCEEYYHLKQQTDKQIHDGVYVLDAARTRIHELETNLNECKKDLEQNMISWSDKWKALEEERVKQNNDARDRKERMDILNRKHNEIIEKYVIKEEELNVFKNVNYKQLEGKYGVLMGKYNGECMDLKNKLEEMQKNCVEKENKWRIFSEQKGEEWNLEKKEYEMNLKTVHDELNEYRLKCKETEIKCNYLEEQNQDLSFSLEEIKQERSRLKDMNEMITEQLTEWREMQFETENEKNEIEQRMKTMSAENEHLYQQNMHKEDEVNELNQRINDLRINNEDLMEQNKEIKDEMSTLQEECESVSNDYTSLQHKYDNDIKNHGINALEMEQNTDQLTDKLVEKENKLERLREEMNEYKSKTNAEYTQNMHTLEQELQSKRYEYERLKEIKHGVQSKNESLQKQIGKLEDNISKIKDHNTTDTESSELIIKSLQNNLKQLQNTKKIQFDALKEAQQNLKNVNSEIKLMKTQHMDEIEELNGKLEKIYKDKLVANGIEYETVDSITNKMETLNCDFVELKKDNDALKSAQKQFQSELDENEQKMEEDELNIITLKNENDQLYENKREYTEKINQFETELSDKNVKIIELNTMIDDLKNRSQENGGAQCKLRVKFDEMEAMYNDIMIQNKYIKQNMNEAIKDRDCVQNRFHSLQMEYDEYKKNETLNNKSNSIKTPKGNELEIRIEILEQQLIDEHKEKKRWTVVIDELKIKNYSLIADLNKLNDDNDDILLMQNLRIKNEKLTKKTKIQQAKIEMYKKKLIKIKNKYNMNKENGSCVIGKRRVSDQSVMSLSSISSANISSLSESSVSSLNKKRKKRTYSEMQHTQDQCYVAIDNERAAKRMRHC